MSTDRCRKLLVFFGDNTEIDDLVFGCHFTTGLLTHGLICGGALLYAGLQLFDKSEEKSGLLWCHIESATHGNILFKYTVLFQCITLTIVTRRVGLKVCNTAGAENIRTGNNRNG